MWTFTFLAGPLDNHAAGYQAFWDKLKTELRKYFCYKLHLPQTQPDKRCRPPLEAAHETFRTTFQALNPEKDYEF